MNFRTSSPRHIMSPRRRIIHRHNKINRARTQVVTNLKNEGPRYLFRRAVNNAATLVYLNNVFWILNLKPFRIFLNWSLVYVPALIWQLMRAYTLSVLTRLANTGNPIIEKEIVQWVNNKLSNAGKTSSIRSFQVRRQIFSQSSWFPTCNVIWAANLAKWT